MISDLAAWTPTTPPRLERPDLKVILGEASAPEWLLRGFHEYNPDAHDPYVIIAAVASIGRLWSPMRGVVREGGYLDALLRGQDPQSRADRWFRDLPEDAHAETSRSAFQESQRLLGPLKTPGLSPVSGWDDDEVTAWLEARDDLAAVQSLLRNEASDGKSTLVREVLVLDRTAQGVLGARVRGLSSPKLRAVAWQYQNAWWGKVYG